MREERSSQAAIDLGALAHNLAEAVRLAGGREVIAVVKADAYGHGAAAVARRLVAAGCRRLAVATVAEGAELRAAGLRAGILVLGGIHGPAEAAEAAALELTPVLQHAAQVAWLRRAARDAGRPLAVQLEVDTGMARMGVAPEEAPGVLEQLARAPELEPEGVYTHLARADEEDLSATHQQLSLFGQVLAAARSRGVCPPCVHVANSAGLLAAEELADVLPSGISAVRPGLLLYGVVPASHLASRASLRPVMHLRTRVVNVRWVRPGDAVGYGGSWRAKQRGRIATLPLGYADGIPWSLGNRGVALLRGQKVPFAGRVSMDLVTLDVGERPVEIGDPVLLFGAEPGAASGRLPVEEVAQAAGTLAYELLCRVGRRVPRVELA